VLREKANDEIERILARYPDKRSAVMPVMYLAQREYGYLSEEAMQEIADLLDMPLSEVYSVAGFYTLFYKEPVGRHVVHVCNDFPCALRGADEMLDHICQRLGIQPGETTPDGAITLETVMCIAACDRAPVMQVDLEYFENLTTEEVDRILEALSREGRGVPDSAS
jgi:NADH-quinone oxidoreductase subunit E